MASDRQQWVFFEHCGCPFGVMEFSGQTQGQAWREFYDYGKASITDKMIARAVSAGATVQLVPHERYESEFLPQMRPSWQCPHGEAS